MTVMHARQDNHLASVPLALGVGVVVLAIALFVASIPPYFRQLASLTLPDLEHPESVQKGFRELAMSTDVYALSMSGIRAFLGAGFIVIAGAIVIRRLDDAFALFVSATLVLFGTTFPDTLPALIAERPVWSIPAKILSIAGFVGFFSLFLLFPSGKFVPRWTRWLIPLWLVEEWFQFFPASHQIVDDIFFLVFLGLVLCSMLAQVYRYRRISTLVEQQQTKWVVFGFVISVLAFLVYGLSGYAFTTGKGYVLHELLGGSVMVAAFLMLPLSIGFAIMRYQLWDVDGLINRTLIYGIVSAAGILFYLLLLIVVGAVAGSAATPVVGAIAIGITAVLIQPVRLRLQSAVNRLLYGQRDDPYMALSHLGRRLEESFPSEPSLAVVAETIAEALRLPYAAIAVEYGSQLSIVAEVGDAPKHVVVFPLIHEQQRVGELRVSPRDAGEQFNGTDMRLLTDLARQSGIAAHDYILQCQARQLSIDLQESRKRIVTLREEERRQLRRELHDGLGPQLAAMTLRIDAVRNIIHDQPVVADTWLSSMSEQTQLAVDEIRRIAHGLGPSALDELGLVRAIQRFAARFNDGRLETTVVAPDDLPRLPAAVDVAIYRIVQESLTNVVRHSHATTCTITIRAEAASSMISCDIADNGRGFSPSRCTGIGHASMRERAAELNGTLEMTSTPGLGSVVSVRIPYSTQPDAGADHTPRADPSTAPIRNWGQEMMQ